ncbi:MAG: hypothetical protein D4R67_02705 [Bacteroidetes bacterium]|nr:MAG: hypothetical protein D4R67_02705 [Bacteroidota bacterium]
MDRIQTLGIFLLLAVSGALAAQNTDSTKTKTRAFQFSFITPIGTNGLNSWEYTNSFSINLLAGYAGGVSGVEFTGLTSILRTDFRGAQFAGLGHVVLGQTRGAQFAGLFNIGIKPVHAWQFAGFINVAAGETKGLQCAGFSNIITDSLSGVQISGLFNFAKKLKGVQIAPFNYVDSLEKGIPIGVLSFVRNGYIGVEFAATETMYGVFSFKTGIRKFYNILSVGAAYRSNMVIWGWGYGLGGMIPLAEKWDLTIEGLCYQMNEGEWFTNRLNLLNKLQVAASWQLSKSVALFGGLSWNVTVSDITDEYGDPVTPHIAPWSVYDKTHGHINIKMYPGITAGIRL